MTAATRPTLPVASTLAPEVVTAIADAVRAGIIAGMSGVTIGTVGQGDAGVDPWAVVGDVEVTNLDTLATQSTLATRAAAAQLPASLGATTKSASLSIALATDQIVKIEDVACSAVTVDKIALTTASQQIVAAGPTRKVLSILNNSTSILYLLAGTGNASTTNLIATLGPAQMYEVPPAQTGLRWAGIGSAANGYISFMVG